MEEAEDAGKNVIGGRQSSCPGRRIRVHEVRFGRFNETGAELVPHKAIKGLGDLTEFVSGIQGLQISLEFVQLGEQGIGKRRTSVLGWIGAGIGGALLLSETTCVPKFVGEITAFFHLLLVVADIRPLGGDAEQTETEPVGPILGDEIQRIR